MLIDEFLPVYDASERHQIDIHAPVERVYAAVHSLHLGASPLIRWLVRLRGFSAPPTLTLDGLLRETSFILLDEKREQELVFGLVGRFWTLSGDNQRLDVAGFHNFAQPGYAKAAWNFLVSRKDANTTRVATETRVYCLDSGSRWRFRLYWALIRPFSGLIRRSALRLLKEKAEGVSDDFSNSS